MKRICQLIIAIVICSALCGCSIINSQENPLDVKLIEQNPELPGGCEIVSGTMLLQYAGFDIDKTTMAEKYLPCSNDFSGIYGPDPDKFYAGDPANSNSRGMVCNDKVLSAALNAYLKEQNTDKISVCLRGTELEDLKKYIDRGYPVAVWASVSMVDLQKINMWTIKETGKPAVGWKNTHCLVMTGYDDNYIYLNDPLNINSKVKTETFKKIYNKHNKMSVVVQ